MTAALEIVRALESAGERAAFVATGQTGVCIADRGVVVDAVVADFVAGEVEALVLAAADEAGIVMVEGQGALHHPAYSGVTLALLHGACPSALVLCHQAGRDRIRTGAGAGWPIAPLATLVEAYESAAAWLRPAKVVGVALNTLGLEESAARAACERAARETGLPATDPVRFGAEALARAVADVAAGAEARRARAPGGRRARATSA
jgi:uncharacterized NAD-dependent epimerase/dehydratase family protein